MRENPIKSNTGASERAHRYVPNEGMELTNYSLANSACADEPRRVVPPSVTAARGQARPLKLIPDVMTDSMSLITTIPNNG